jgi:hypothetical protein
MYRPAGSGRRASGRSLPFQLMIAMAKDTRRRQGLPGYSGRLNARVVPLEARPLTRRGAAQNPMISRYAARVAPPRDQERSRDAQCSGIRCVLPPTRGLCPLRSACAKVISVTQASYVDRARVVGKATISVGLGIALLSVLLPNIGCIGPALTFLGFAAGLCIVLVGALLRLLAWRAERHHALWDRELDEP